MKKLISILMVLLLLVVLTGGAFAHSGALKADGGHFQKTTTKQVTYTNVVNNFGFPVNIELRLNGVLINKGETRVFNDIPVNYEIKTYLFKNPDGTPIYSSLVVSGTLQNGTNTILYQLPNNPPQLTFTIDMNFMVQNYHYHQGPFKGQTVNLLDKNIKWSDREKYYSEHAPFLTTAAPTTEPTIEPTLAPATENGVVTPVLTSLIVKQLPKTGESGPGLAVILGFSLVFTGLTVMYFKRDRVRR